MRRSSLPLILVVAFAARADAATFLVNTTADTFDNVCNIADCSLKDAVFEAEQTPQADTIELQDGATYTITTFANNINAFVVINTPIHIAGHGSTIKHGSMLPLVRYFRVGPTGDLSLENLTVRDGSVFNDFGAAIRSEGDLTIDNCQFLNNSATYEGGAIYNQGATLVVTRSTFVGNTSHRGGAICTDGFPADPQAVIVDDSSFQGNKALTLAAASGGAIFMRGDTTATLSDSTFTGNSSDVVGGAISFHSIPLAYTVDLINLTIVGNTAYNDGGGLFTHNCTGPTCPVVTKPRLTNVIVANNLGTVSTSPNCGGYFVSVGHNIIGGPNSGCFIVPPTNPPDYPVTTLAGLGPVQNNGNGGGLFTPPTATCQAVDAGDASFSAVVDQLAFGRTGVSSEVGAIEYRSCVPPPADMIDWWHFDEITGSVGFDIAGSAANNGTHQVGVPSTTQGVVARARCFNGVTQRMTVPDDAELDFAGDCSLGAADPFTIDAWVKTLAGGRQPLLDKRQSAPNFLRGYELFIHNGQLGFEMANGAGNPLCGTVGSACEAYLAPPVSSGGVNLADNRWHHVAVVVTRCPTVLGEMYIDGTLAHTFTPLTGDIANTANLIVGGAYAVNGTSLQFRGCLDEIELFRRALSAAEIAALYEAGWAGKCKPAGTEIGAGTCMTGAVHGVKSVGTATGKMAHDCINDAALGSLGGLTARDCLTADRNGKVAQATAKATAVETKKCEDIVVRIGPDGTEAGLAAVAVEELALVSDLFGPELDTTLALESADPDAARCQDTVVKGAQKILAAKVKTFESCVKKLYKAAATPTADQLASCVGDITEPSSIAAAAQPSGKIGVVAAKLATTIAKQCGDIDVATRFPGSCGTTDPTTLGQCVEARVECRACRLITHANRLAVDCDTFDDGVANASCAS